MQEQNKSHSLILIIKIKQEESNKNAQLEISVSIKNIIFMPQEMTGVREYLNSNILKNLKFLQSDSQQLILNLSLDHHDFL